MQFILSLVLVPIVLLGCLYSKWVEPSEEER